MPLSTGQILHNDRYRIVKLLGQGGMGAVYRAWDLSLRIPVAIKENLDASAQAQKQFGREAHFLARLSHPNLPRVTDYFFIPGQGQYLVMDYIEGEDLATMLQQQGALEEDKILAWTRQICAALDYLHSQESPIIHRDIKPANIKIRPDGRAMLVDFGIAKVYDPHLATTIGAKAVTPGYSPPEQYGGGITDGRSDIYALGATLYHLLTGKLPPESVELVASQKTMISPRATNPKISPYLESIILKCVALARDQRYQSVAELREALKPAPAEKPAGDLLAAVPASQAAASQAASALGSPPAEPAREQIKPASEPKAVHLSPVDGVIDKTQVITPQAPARSVFWPRLRKWFTCDPQKAQHKASTRETILTVCVMGIGISALIFFLAHNLFGIDIFDIFFGVTYFFNPLYIPGYLLWFIWSLSPSAYALTKRPLAAAATHILFVLAIALVFFLLVEVLGLVAVADYFSNMSFIFLPAISYALIFWLLRQRPLTGRTIFLGSLAAICTLWLFGVLFGASALLIGAIATPLAAAITTLIAILVAKLFHRW